LSYSIAVLGKRRIALGTVAAVFCVSSPALAASPASQNLGNRTLQKGMTGADVAILQQDLTIAGFQTLTTGVFSEGTKLHLESFQARYGLTADGVAGPQTVQQIKKIVKRAASREAADVSSTGAASLSGTATTPTTATTPGTATAGTAGTAGTTGTTTTASGATTSTTPSTLAPSDSGGLSAVPPPSNAPYENASLSSAGLAVPPVTAPMVVREVIEAANQIAFTPYVYGGGHASFTSVGYDCSGSTSFALHGGGLIVDPIDSTQFESYGLPGPGRWITMWANGGHVYMRIAGLWFDTAAQSTANGSNRWSLTRISPAAGFVEIHPAGW
jgi:hypothetical protein